MTGRFIVVEGPDGIGKSSLCKAIVEKLGDEAIYTREPGGTPTAESIRQVLKGDEAAEEQCTLGELFLVMAARSYHQKFILQQLALGKTVVCDRWVGSSYIYQCQLGGVEPAILDVLTKMSGLIKPQLQFIVELEDGGSAVVAGRPGEPIDHLDRRSLETPADWTDNRLESFAHATIYTKRRPTPELWAQHIIETYLV